MTEATVTPIKPKKPTEAERFSYEGEFLDVEPEVAAAILARYSERALALHEAKAAAFAVEEEIKLLMGGHENLRVNGEVKVTWKWGAKTTFDKRGLRQDHPEILEEYTHTDPLGTRTFNAKGVVGVD